LLGLWILLTMCCCAPDALAQLDNGQAASGLNEALTIGTGDAINLIGRAGGYFSNPRSRSISQEAWGCLKAGLRRIGYGPQIDEFVCGMNSAAEAAASMAKSIFIHAIDSMSFSDARRIVSQGGHSATDYFQRETMPELTAAFTPLVKQEMAKYSVTKQYDVFSGAASPALPG
jgi:hypothetical protein